MPLKFLQPQLSALKTRRVSSKFLSVVAIFLFATACSQQDTTEPTEPTEKITNMVILNTNHGDIKIELDEEKAPLTVANFKAYAESGHYNGTIFHRVIRGFMIQGGGFSEDMVQKATQSPLFNEADNGLLNNKYTISMARTPDPHSATSQFFINTNDNTSLNHTAKDSRGWGYAVFGKVVEGSDVVDKIEGVATTSRAGHRDVPADTVVINSVTFE